MNRLKFHSVISAIILLTMVLSGCAAKKRLQPTLLPDNGEFFRSGLAELSVIIGKPDKTRKLNRAKTDLISMIDNLITGTANLNTFRYVPEYQSIHGWINVPSPRVATLRINGFGSVDAYVEGGKSLTLSIDPESGKVIFGGDLGKVNCELANVPTFKDAERLTNEIEKGFLKDSQEARKQYEQAFARWSDSVDSILSKADLSDEGRRMISFQPRFQKAYWYMLHENFLGLKTSEDYAALRDVMTIDDSHFLAQKWAGGLVKNLASSPLLKRLADMIHQEKDSTLKGAIVKYMRRYDALSIFLGINGIPKLTQVAAARTLCAGGFLKRAKTKDEALTIVDTVADSYIPDPEIRKIAEEYARHLFHDDFREIEGNTEGALLKDLISKYKGKYVVLDFWNYMCTPCIREMRDTRAVRVKYRGNPDWVILYVTGDEPTSREQYEKVRAKYLEGDETVWLPHSIHGRIAAMFDLHEVPRKILFDRDGNIIDEQYQLNFDELNSVDK